MIAWVLHTAIGCCRQMYDTRLYTEVYNTIVIDTVLRQRQAGIEATKVAARSGMSREFVTFFEKDMPVVINTLVGIVGSAAILFYYDLVIGAVATLLFVPVAIINRGYMRRSLMLNAGAQQPARARGRRHRHGAGEDRRGSFREGARLARQALRRRCAELDDHRGAVDARVPAGAAARHLSDERRNRHHLRDFRLCLAADGEARHGAADRPAADAPQGHPPAHRGRRLDRGDRCKRSSAPRPTRTRPP